MKLLLDTANIDQIRKFTRSTVVKGVTTNPSLMSKEQKGDYTNHLHGISSLIRPGYHFSVEVTTLDPQKMYDQAQLLYNAIVRSNEESVDLHIKIPVLVETLDIITALTSHGIKVNATACMTAMQAKLAIDAGASVVSFFYNRIKDGGGNPNDEIRLLREIDESWVPVICGSIREPDDVKACFLAGADYVTVSPAIIEKMMFHPQTDKAVKQFQVDIEKWLS